MIKIKEANSHICYIYTIVRTKKPTILQFIVDPSVPTINEQRKGITSYPGDRYYANQMPEMLNAFNGSTADKELTKDRWGVFLSGYAPVRDKSGKAVAILGVDMKADDVYNEQIEVKKRIFLIFVFGIVLSCLIGINISQRISQPIMELINGINFVSHGNLKYRVKIDSDEREINEIAKSFNEMSANLDNANQELHRYFRQILESLTYVLEAKDTYTRGHSERVADISMKIALGMGFSQEDARLIHDMANLHDIGKVGIAEGILNKTDRLSDDEWLAIQQHPVIGEKILSPFLLSDEKRAIIRNHHERFDGKGYPDKLERGNTHIFAQIISVADAYDAMISDRAYRPALSKESAIQELIKNQGSQFNPKIVNTYIKILEIETEMETVEI